MRNAVGSLICKEQKSRQSENGKEFLPKHRPPSRASPPQHHHNVWHLCKTLCCIF